MESQSSSLKAMQHTESAGTFKSIPPEKPRGPVQQGCRQICDRLNPLFDNVCAVDVLFSRQRQGGFTIGWRADNMHLDDVVGRADNLRAIEIVPSLHD